LFALRTFRGVRRAPEQEPSWLISLRPSPTQIKQKFRHAPTDKTDRGVVRRFITLCYTIDSLNAAAAPRASHAQAGIGERIYDVDGTLAMQNPDGA
jgi:hypothetical protein